VSIRRTSSNADEGDFPKGLVTLRWADERRAVEVKVSEDEIANDPEALDALEQRILAVWPVLSTAPEGEMLRRGVIA
jgi:hypothetical protein